MTLWAIAKSPLIFGGDATQLDAFTLSLLGNKEVLDMNAHSIENRQVYSANFSVIWTAQGPRGQFYVAVFNTEDTNSTSGTDRKTIEVKLTDLGLPNGTAACSGRNMWSSTVFATEPIGAMRIAVDPHGVALVS